MVTQPERKAKRKATKRPAKAPRLDHIVADLHPLATPMSKLRPDPKNARLHGEVNLAAVKRSLVRFKQRKPVIVRRSTCTITAGNATFTAALELGWKHIAAVWVDDDDASATGYAIADNRTAELAEWDAATLARLTAELRESEAELLADIGFTAAELAAILPPADWTPPDKEGDIGDHQRQPSRSVRFDKDQWNVVQQLGDNLGERLYLLAVEALERS